MKIGFIENLIGRLGKIQPEEVPRRTDSSVVILTEVKACLELAE